MASNRQYLVIYDISDSKRLRKIDHIVSGYGYRLQYSVFLCSLSDTAKSKLRNQICSVINNSKDQCCIIDLGVSENIQTSFLVMGRPLIKIPQITFL